MHDDLEQRKSQHLDLVQGDVETADTLFFEATVHTATLEARVYDAFTLRDGKAHRHFTGLISATPLAQAK